MADETTIPSLEVDTEVEVELTDRYSLKNKVQMVQHFCSIFSDFFSFFSLLPLFLQRTPLKEPLKVRPCFKSQFCHLLAYDLRQVTIVLKPQLFSIKWDVIKIR